MAEARMGISTDYSRERFDVALDETDLQRLATEYGFDYAAGLTTMQAVRLLTVEAERYALIQAPKFGRPVDAVRAQLLANREEFAVALADVTGLGLAQTRKQLGLPDAPP